MRTYPPGVPSWIDLEQPDLEAAQRFYGGVLGWTFEAVTPPGAPAYVIARLDGQDVAGLAHGHAGWSTYVAVDEVDRVAAAVESAGGRVVSGPVDAGPAGRWAECVDPVGASFRLWQAGRRLGAQVTNAPGSWNFSDLHADDPARTKAFYGTVFGWEFDDIGFGVMIKVPGYGEHLASTVDPGIHERQVDAPPGFADAVGWLAPADAGQPPHWHVTFTVADRDEAAREVARLGGEVVATDDNEWTRTALVRDPGGARFTASEFAPSSGDGDGS
jgi:predicted enzyme related to lactoylglutathione lyase